MRFLELAKSLSNVKDDSEYDEIFSKIKVRLQYDKFEYEEDDFLVIVSDHNQCSSWSFIISESVERNGLSETMVVFLIDAYSYSPDYSMIRSDVQRTLMKNIDPLEFMKIISKKSEKIIEQSGPKRLLSMLNHIKSYYDWPTSQEIVEYNNNLKEMLIQKRVDFINKEISHKFGLDEQQLKQEINRKISNRFSNYTKSKILRLEKEYNSIRSKCKEII